MANISRKKLDLIFKIIVCVLLVALIGGVTYAIVRVAQKEDTKEISSLAYKIGALDDNGDFVKNTCKQAFGEQIVLNVSSKTKNASASANVDYLKRVNDITLTIRSEEGDTITCDGQELDQICGNGDSVCDLLGSKTSRVPSYTFSWTFTYSTGTTVGSTYMATRDGTQLNNGVSLQFDEQSTVTWGSQFESGIYYNGSVIYNLVIGIVDPVRSISVGSLVF